MRVLIIYRILTDEKGTLGIVQKQLSQAKAFRNLGHDCDIINLCQDGIQLNAGLIKTMDFKNEPLKSINLLSRFFISLRNLVKSNYDLVYIRYSPLSLGLSQFARQLRKANSTCKVVLDFPTFPFIEEYSGLKKILAQRILKRTNNHSEVYDSATVLDDRKRILGIPTIQISNAIDIDRFPIAKIGTSNDLKLIFTGNISRAQGLDRLIEGMKEYKGGRKLRLIVVGEGKEKEELERRTLPIRDQVTFLGAKFGTELDQLFDGVDLAIGKLGMHRIGFQYSSGLKHRDYCARGIPFILSCRDRAFDDRKFVLKFSPDESAIEVEKLVSFLEKLEVSREEIREYAIRNLKWEQQLAKIICRIELEDKKP